MKWLYANVRNSDVLPISESLYAPLDSYGYKIEPNPHVTILPGFKASQITIPSVSVTELSITGFGFYPSMEQPMVIYLNVENARLQKLREQILTQIGSESVQFEVTPFHITLVKQGDDGDQHSLTFTDSQRNAVTEAIAASEPLVPDTVTVNSIKTDDW